MVITACDVSEHQGSVVNNSYPHRWLTFRACFGGSYVDKKLAGNLAWSKTAKTAGRLDGYTVYVVYLPGQNQAILSLLDKQGVPRDCHIMIDAEKWEGQSYQINGDHSTEINQLADALATRQGSRDRVWGYGNRGPDLEVWPRKPSWLGWVVASYGGTKPDVPNLVGWQYTDGAYTVPGLPTSSSPFGACDHNQLYITPEADMPLTPADLAAVNKVVAGQFSRFYADVDAKGVLHDHALITWLNRANAPLLAQLNHLTAQVTALTAALEAVRSAQVTVTPTDVPISGTVHIGGTP